MKHIKEFDGLRGLLALWVFASHVLEIGPYSAAAAPVRPNLAVDIFIILSGFVIFHLLSTGEDYRTFITRRWFRLFPVFAVCFLAALALFAWMGVDDVDVFGINHTKHLTPYLAAHATMLHGIVPEQFLPHSARAILVPAWSISVEWQFYLVAPLLFAFAMRPTKGLAAFVVGLIALRVLCDVMGRAHEGLQFDMRAFLPLRLEFFAVGVGSFGVWQWLSRRDRSIEVPRFVYALLVPVLLLVGKQSPAIALWLIGFIALIHVHFGSNGITAQSFTRVLNCPPAQFLGKISYPLYLLHLPALVFVRQIIRAQQPGLHGPVLQAALVLGGLAASILGAWLLHEFIEQPMIRLGKRITAGWKLRYPAPGVLAVEPLRGK